MTDVIGVSALNRYVKSTLDSDGFLSDLALRGEVSGFVNHVKSGHWYFTLKDEKASVKAVMFRQEARRLGFVPQDGMRVVVRCRVSLYEATGSFQVYVQDLFPDGLGAAQLAFDQLKARLEAEGHRCYDVPMGGASPVGSAAFIGGYLEMMEQCAQLGVAPTRLYAATGTGGTLAGLVAGRKALGVGPEITGVAVSRKDAGYEGRCAELANASLEWLGSETRVTAADFDVERGYFEPGYEQPNEAANEAIRLLARTEGLLTDPVYTGKALAGLIGHVREGRIAPGETVIFWHTGGATALFAEQAILGDLAKK